MIGDRLRLIRVFVLADFEIEQPQDGKAEAMTTVELRPVETIAALVAKAHKYFAKADEIIEGPYKSARLAAGAALLELRERIEAGEAGDVTWWDWYGGMFTRSRSDAEKVMALARAPDPRAAHEAAKAKHREQNQAYRDRHGPAYSQANSQAKSTPAPVSGKSSKPDLRVVKLAPRQEPTIRRELLKRLEAEFLALTSDEQIAFVRMITKHLRG